MTVGRREERWQRATKTASRVLLCNVDMLLERRGANNCLEKKGRYWHRAPIRSIIAPALPFGLSRSLAIGSRWVFNCLTGHPQDNEDIQVRRILPRAEPIRLRILWRLLTGTN